MQLINSLDQFKDFVKDNPSCLHCRWGGAYDYCECDPSIHYAGRIGNARECDKYYMISEEKIEKLYTRLTLPSHSLVDLNFHVELVLNESERLQNYSKSTRQAYLFGRKISISS